MAEISDSTSVLAHGHSDPANEAKPTPQPAAHDYGNTVKASYPTQSLAFLQAMRREEKGKLALTAAHEQARLKLKIVVVGAGLGGLSLAIALTRKGHSVQILEQASKLGEVRASSLPSYGDQELISGAGWCWYSDSTKLREIAAEMGSLRAPWRTRRQAGRYLFSPVGKRPANRPHCTRNRIRRQL